MAKYISLDALEAEIEKNKKHWTKIENVSMEAGNIYSANNYRGRVDMCNAFLSYINTIEVKEIDLEKELNDYGYHYDYVSLADRKELIDFAKHFLERGLIIQKGE